MSYKDIKQATYYWNRMKPEERRVFLDAVNAAGEVKDSAINTTEEVTLEADVEIGSKTKFAFWLGGINEGEGFDKMIDAAYEIYEDGCNCRGFANELLRILDTYGLSRYIYSPPTTPVDAELEDVKAFIKEQTEGMIVPCYVEFVVGVHDGEEVRVGRGYAPYPGKLDEALSELTETFNAAINRAPEFHQIIRGNELIAFVSSETLVRAFRRSAPLIQSTADDLDDDVLHAKLDEIFDDFIYKEAKERDANVDYRKLKDLFGKARTETFAGMRVKYGRGGAVRRLLPGPAAKIK